MENKKSLHISIKCFISALATIFALMLFTYILTFIIPGGEYARTINAKGNAIIDTTKAFTFVDGGIPFWKWILSPVLVLGFEGSALQIAIIVFLLIIGGVFNCLDNCGFMHYMLDMLSAKFGKVRYQFMAILMAFFMFMGAFIGSFEEVVPIIPIVVAVSIKLGWDALTGLGMSLLAVGCGFSSGVCNPFTVGLGQTLVGLPMFSGVSVRLISFVLIYGLLWLCVSTHAKKIAKEPEILGNDFVKNEALEKAIKRFATIFLVGIVVVMSSSFLTFLQDYTIIIIALVFLVGGIVSSFTAKMTVKQFFKVFKDGAVSIMPSILLILMASSIKYILVTSKIQDTLLYYAINAMQNMPKGAVVLCIYLLVLVMNFFIASGSAKAFMLIPLITPLANYFGISSQLSILAFAYGDGFSNVFYPTNPTLLIGLGLVDTKYGQWIKYSWKFQALNLVLTSTILLISLLAGY